jgi:hypothetical protein
MDLERFSLSGMPLSMSHRQIFMIRIKKYDDARPISKRNTTDFILVHALLKSNNLTSSLVVL